MLQMLDEVTQNVPTLGSLKLPFVGDAGYGDVSDFR